MAKRIGIAAAVALASLGLMAGAPAGDEARPSPRAPTIDQSLEMQTVGQPKISPDGRRVIWEESRTNWASNAFETDLWIADATGEGRRRLTSGVKSSRSAAWSPDGKWIAFTTRISGQFQIGVFDVARRTAQLITTVGGEDPDWTRDSRHLVYSNNGRLYLLDTVSRQSLPIETGVSGSGEPTVSR